LSAWVVDASALLAYLHSEEGAEVVAEAVAETAAISSANWAETLSKLGDAGHVPSDVGTELEEQGLIPGLIEVEPLTADDSLAIAELRLRTGDRSLSLGDCACLALGQRLELPVLTADRRWSELDELGVDVKPIRP
jgi:ribonuclease VapC